MATVPATIKGSKRGIQRTLANFVIESETITETPVQEDFDDQNGARADEQVYDTREDLALTIYAANENAAISGIVVAMPTGYTGTPSLRDRRVPAPRQGRLEGALKRR